MFSRESDMIRTLRFIEGLKAALIAHIAALYRAMAENSDIAMKKALAQLVMHAYVLGRRIGIDYEELDETVKDELKNRDKSDDDIEDRFGDFSRLAYYFSQKRGKNGE